jgi:hydrogenase/urease accessory protein HupE
MKNQVLGFRLTLSLKLRTQVPGLSTFAPYHFGPKKLILFLFSFLFSLSSFSFAHWSDLSAAEISTKDNQTQIILTFPTGLVAAMDTDGNQILSEDEIKKHQTELTAFFTESISLTDNRQQQPSLSLSTNNSNLPTDLGVAPGTHSTLKLIYTWEQNPQGMTINYNLFLPGVSTASCLATLVQDGQGQTFVFTPENRILTLEQGKTPLWSQVKSFVILGVEHILTGYDHLLFLLALLALGGSFTYLLKVVSAFTLAHSITLTLATLNIISLPPRFIESVIALSIAYVAAENLWRKREKAERWRWALTFGFGLIHGMGFAGILQEMAIPKSSLVISLVSFNLGVELGQLAFMSIAFLILSLAKRLSWDKAITYGASVTAIAAGIFWFVERAFLG